ncbi:MAG: transcriptional activator RfaH [Hellea sp.]|nr:transcriptional activator RfaH [Hellea sp.]
MTEKTKSLSANWYAAQLKANGFSKAVANLNRQGFQSFMPLRRKTVRHARQIGETLKPVFPGYLFIRFGERQSDWRKVNSTIGVSKLISFSQNLPAPVPQELIDSLRLRCDQKNILLPLTDLATGDRVKILSGAFSEFNGQIETLLPGDCARLLLQFMGQTTRVDIAKTELERSDV